MLTKGQLYYQWPFLYIFAFKIQNSLVYYIYKPVWNQILKSSRIRFRFYLCYWIATVLGQIILMSLTFRLPTYMIQIILNTQQIWQLNEVMYIQHKQGAWHIADMEYYTSRHLKIIQAVSVGAKIKSRCLTLNEVVLPLHQSSVGICASAFSC